MLCSSADWVRGLARLISSAISSWAKTGPSMKRKERRPVSLFLHHLGAQDVGRHQVGRELDALGFHAQHDAQSLDQLGLGEARDADQQQVAARQERNQGLIDDILLAINDLADRGARGPELGAQPLDVGQGGEGIGVGRGRSVWGHRGAPVVRGIKGQGSPELRPEQGHDG